MDEKRSSAKGNIYYTTILVTHFGLFSPSILIHQQPWSTDALETVTLWSLNSVPSSYNEGFLLSQVSRIEVSFFQFERNWDLITQVKYRRGRKCVFLKTCWLSKTLQNSKLITLPNMESQAKNHQKFSMLLPSELLCLGVSNWANTLILLPQGARSLPESSLTLPQPTLYGSPMWTSNLKNKPPKFNLFLPKQVLLS